MIIDKPRNVTSFIDQFINYVSTNIPKVDDVESLYFGLLEKYDIEQSHSLKSQKLLKDKLRNELSSLSEKYNTTDKNAPTIDTAFFNQAITQMKLEYGIDGHPLASQIAILVNLRNHTSSEYHLEDCSHLRVKLFQIALDFYVACDMKVIDCPDENIKQVIRSARYLRRKGVDLQITNGRTEINSDADFNIFTLMEAIINRVGPMNTLRRLLLAELHPLLDNKHQRYMIHRHKHSGTNTIKLSPPYNLLLQICLKNLKNNYPIVIKDDDTIYFELIEMAIHYTVCLGLQPGNFYEDLFIDYKAVPDYLVRNIIYDTFFYIQQWNPAYCIKLTQNAFSGLYEHFSSSSYNLSSYMAVMKFFLRSNAVLKTFTYTEIKEGTNLRNHLLSAILSDISHVASELNNKFSSVLEETNFYNKPLVETSPGVYLLVSPVICGFSFYQVLYRNCYNTNKKREFNDKQGEKIEQFVKLCLKEKGIPFSDGHYQFSYYSNKEKRECDLILEGDQRIAFVEIKKTPLPDDFEKVDLFGIIQRLAEGLLYAQSQAFRHKIQIEREGEIKLYHDAAMIQPSGIIRLNGKVVCCICLVSQEYGFLSYATFGRKLLQLMVIGNFGAVDPKNALKLEKINQMAKQFSSLYEIYAGDKDLKLHEVFHSFTFRTWQQLMYVLEYSSTSEELIKNLIGDTYLDIGTNDYYSQFFYQLRLE